MHAYWALDDAYAAEDGTAGLTAVLARWGRLVKLVAKQRNAHADSVFDTARMLRVPDTTNYKQAEPAPVVGYADSGGPLTVAEVDERLDEAEIPQHDNVTSSDVLSTPDDWRYADRDCRHAAKMIRQWATDPVMGRNPKLYSRGVRLAAAQRFGCLTADLYQDGVQQITRSHAEHCARPGDTRRVGPREVEKAIRAGQRTVSTWTDEQLLAEVKHPTLSSTPWTGRKRLPPNRK